MHQEPILEARHLGKSFGNKMVLEDVSFSLFKGEIVGLLGANGAGKTTLFTIILGFTKPDKGEIFLRGEEVTNAPTDKRALLGMNYLAQEPSIFRSLSVEENILCIAERLDIPKERQKELVEHYLSEMHLQEIKKKKAALLSGGEKRRVEIARALVTNPSLLLLDEPFANIDPKTIFDVKEMIKMLSKKGITILITDHNAREICTLVHRSYLLSKGRVVAEGTSEDLLASKEAKASYFGESFSI